MRVSVKNFQSLDDVALDVEGLTVIVGPSNSGKSALVRAIQSALFNRSDAFFVRKGATMAEVSLDAAPGNVNVAWQKGKKAVFTVNGERFEKVGKDAPPALQLAGYKPVPIGDTVMRAQVAAQFDPLFLLPDSGSVLVDALAAASHLDVFANAVDLCADDVRGAKTLSREAAERADAMAPVWSEIEASATAWVERTSALKTLSESLVERLSLTHGAVALWYTHRAASAVSSPKTLPPLPDASIKLACVAAAHHTAAARVMVPRAPAPLPDADSVKRVLSEGRKLVFGRRVLAPSALPVLPSDAVTPLAEAVKQYHTSLATRNVLNGTLAGKTRDVEAAVEALQAFEREHPTCPTCNQPRA